MSAMLRAVFNKLNFMAGTNFQVNYGTGPSSGTSNVEPPIVDAIGTITVHNEVAGVLVIDRKYVWRLSSSTSKCDFGLRKGDKVKYCAEYSRDLKSHVITSVTPLNRIQDSASSSDQLNQVRKSHFKVVSLRHKTVVANQGSKDKEVIEIDRTKLPKDSAVCVGDWLEVTLDYGEDLDAMEAEVVATCWSEVENKGGRVERFNDSWTLNGHTFISDEMAEANGLHEGLYVKVKAISADYETVSRRGAVWVFRKRAIDLQVPTLLARNQPFVNTEVNEDDCDDTVSSHLEDLLADKNNIRILPTVTNLLIPNVSQSVSQLFEITNTGSKPVMLEKVVVEGIQDVCDVILTDLKGLTVPESLVIEPKTTVEIRATCTSSNCGRTKELLLFDFGTFSIGRILTVTTCMDKDGKLSKLQPKPGVKPKTNKDRRDSPLFSDSAKRICAKPVRSNFYIPNQIERYSIPRNVKKIFKKTDESLLKEKFPDVEKPLSPDNYLDRFKYALWFEELEQQKLRDQFNVAGAELLKTSADYVYTVVLPRLHEIQPPLMPGDQVLVAEEGNTKIEFVGYVYTVNGTASTPEIQIKFSEKFEHGGNRVNLKFLASRTTFRRQHFAVEQAKQYLGDGWLFPTVVETKEPRMLIVESGTSPHEPILESAVQSYDTKPEFKGRQVDIRAPVLFQVDSNVVAPDPLMEFDLKWFNAKLNQEQKEAVRRILRGQGRPLPYIVYGPPGTGKTVTLVEAIMQIYFMDSNSRILVTAPSNAAADLIAEKLVSTNRFCPGELVRFNGFTRNELGVPDSLAYYCMDGDNLESVAKHRLIVSTIATAGQFFSLNLYTGHFSHVFVDEAGYCTEPEALISCILSAVDKEGQVVFAGDPKQLGPVLMCDFGACSILRVSILERLMQSPVYARDEKAFPETKYNPFVLTKLVKNYRAHPGLLLLCQKFYDEELEACAPSSEVKDLAASLKFLPQPGFPLVFHGVRGKCEQDVESPSWFNLSEVSTVIQYIQNLTQAGVKDSDIGIITPYRKQVDKIRSALTIYFGRQSKVKVASVQEFQGGEKKVIIISTVRCNLFSEQKKLAGRLDFISCPKLYNVAVTRAKALLIVVGDPHALYTTTHWGKLLRICIGVGVYKGSDLPERLDGRLRKVVSPLPPPPPSVTEQVQGISRFIS